MKSVKLSIYSLVFFVGLIVSPSPGVAQEQFRYSAVAETLFNKGLDQYETGSFENAAESFEIAVNINPVHQRTTACYLMAAKSWLNISEQAQAMFLLTNLLKRFPESEYSQDAHFTLGTAYFLLNQPKSSVKEFLSSIDENQNDLFTQRAESLLDSIVTFVLTPAEQQELLSETQSSYLKKIVDRVASSLSNPPVDQEQPKEPPPKKKKTKFLTIGALLPLMGNIISSPVKQAAEDLLDGMKLAIDEFERTDSEVEILLDVKDTERDSISAKEFTRGFAGDRKCLAVIGPLFSNTTFACAPIANKGEIPLITPTANAVGIAETGEYVFQMNANIALHGKALAQYTVGQMGLTSLAVIAPRDPLVKILTNEFIAEAKRLGAAVMANETYSSTVDDLSKQFLALRKASAGAEPLVSFEKRIPSSTRKKILAAGVPAAVLDSLIDARGKIPVSALFGKGGLRKAEALNLRIIDPKKAASQNKEIAVNAIQGVFAPVLSSDDIGVIASQMTYYNIKTQLIGNADWYDEALLQTQKRYTDGAIFCSGYYLNNDDPAILAIQRKLKKNPTKYTLFGYDVMNLLLSCITKGATTREELRECLSNIENWQGLQSTITLKEGRVNRTVQILQFAGGDVNRVSEIHLQK